MDTGFTGDLSLPLNAIRRLGLSPLGRRFFTLANGERTSMNAYSGTLLWHERAQEVVVIQSGSAPLLGMGLLWGSRVTFDAMDGGGALIEEITSA